MTWHGIALRIKQTYHSFITVVSLNLKYTNSMKIYNYSKILRAR